MLVSGGVGLMCTTTSPAWLLDILHSKGKRMSQMDWTIATDDLVCERWRTCALCGAPHVRWADVHTVGALALAAVLCARCHQADPPRTRLAALLHQRYGGGGDAPSI